jgi:hypothetical protein
MSDKIKKSVDWLDDQLQKNMVIDHVHMVFSIDIATYSKLKDEGKARNHNELKAMWKDGEGYHDDDSEQNAEYVIQTTFEP